jgi:hypothetical protein
MSNQAAIVYFGAQPKHGETVSEDLKELGINLLRLAPCQVSVHGGPTHIQPNYSVYKAHLPLFIHSAIEETRITPTSDLHNVINYTGPVISIPLPSLVVSFATAVSEDLKDELKGKGFRDTVIRGKPALIADKPTLELARLARDKGCQQTTAAIENTMNLKDFRFAIFILRTMTAFFKLNQYPAFLDDDHVEEFSKQFEGFMAR